MSKYLCLGHKINEVDGDQFQATFRLVIKQGWESYHREAVHRRGHTIIVQMQKW